VLYVSQILHLVKATEIIIGGKRQAVRVQETAMGDLQHAVGTVSGGKVHVVGPLGTKWFLLCYCNYTYVMMSKLQGFWSFPLVQGRV
jgi:hypothetical protein